MGTISILITSLLTLLKLSIVSNPLALGNVCILISFDFTVALYLVCCEFDYRFVLFLAHHALYRYRILNWVVTCSSKASVVQVSQLQLLGV